MNLQATIIPGRIENGRFRPTSEITDRAKRYRANKSDATPKKHCFSCGAKNPRDRAHIDGNESNNDPRNLAPQCRSCNVRFANTLHKAGVGKKTRQYNPKKRASSPSLGAYLSAIAIARGDQPGNVTSAVRTLQATTPAQRSQYAKRIWEIRRERYGSTGRQDSLPF